MKLQKVDVDQQARMTSSSKIFNRDKYHFEENVCLGAGLLATSKNSLGYWCLEVIDGLCSASVQNEKRKWNHELIRCIFPFQTCGNKTAYCFRITAPVQ